MDLDEALLEATMLEGVREEIASDTADVAVPATLFSAEKLPQITAAAPSTQWVPFVDKVSVPSICASSCISNISERKRHDDDVCWLLMPYSYSQRLCHRFQGTMILTSSD